MDETGIKPKTPSSKDIERNTRNSAGENIQYISDCNLKFIIHSKQDKLKIFNLSITKTFEVNRIFLLFDLDLDMTLILNDLDLTSNKLD